MEVPESQTENNYGSSATLSLAETLSNPDETQSLARQQYAHITVQGSGRLHAGNSYVSQQTNYYGPATSSSAAMSLQSALGFPEMSLRLSSVARAQPKTCEWILETLEFSRWRNPAHRCLHHGILWIRGKPGAGKSTIMKFLTRRHQEAFKVRAKPISFFFSARATATLARSTEGMYRALLYQIIEDVPELQNLVEPEARECYKQQGWPLELLKDLLRDAVLVYGREQTITCYVDALDECEEDEVREMLVSLEELGSETTAAGVEFLICLASRHYPNLRVSHLEEIVLNDRHGHQDDISRYVESKLNLQKVEQKLELASEIRRRSSGVFLWVVLVVAILNKLGAQGNVHQLQSRLQAIPTNLRELFDDILDRDESNENLVPMIQWTLFAGRRLSAIELYIAVLLCTSHSAATAGLWHKRLIDEQVLRDFILTSSKGLLETSQISQTSTPEGMTYGFIHESVREYFLDTGLQRLDPTLRGNVRAMSQDQLARACTDHIPHLSALMDEYDLERLPLLNYLRRYGAFYHADRAESEGLCQNDFCAGFPLHDWFLICNMGPSNMYLAENNATLLHVLVKHGYKSLARRELKRYLEFTGQHRPRKAFANAQCGSWGTALHIAINDDENEMACMLVANGFDINAQVGSIGTPLVAAVNRQNTEMVQFLLSKGADSNISCGDLGTALHTLAHRKNHNFLFDKRVAARAGAARGRTPDSNTIKPDFGDYYAFVDKTDMGILQLLLSNGADVNIGFDLVGTVLHSALLNKRSSIIPTLLANGADITACCQQHGTPLDLAMSRGNGCDIVELMFRHGVNQRVWQGDQIIDVLMSVAKTYDWGGEPIGIMGRGGLFANVSLPHFADALIAAAGRSPATKRHFDILRALLYYLPPAGLSSDEWYRYLVSVCQAEAEKDKDKGLAPLLGNDAITKLFEKERNRRQAKTIFVLRMLTSRGTNT